LESWHLLEIGGVLLTETIFNLQTIKLQSMKELIIKISVHVFVGLLLTNMSQLIIQFGGQAIAPDRCIQLNF